jgi:hypothetical protein
VYRTVCWMGAVPQVILNQPGIGSLIGQVRTRSRAGAPPVIVKASMSFVKGSYWITMEAEER